LSKQTQLHHNTHTSTDRYAPKTGNTFSYYTDLLAVLEPFQAPATMFQSTDLIDFGDQDMNSAVSRKEQADNVPHIDASSGKPG